ncbi:MAG: hypothetical protein R2731_09620 [Nocardioides sp.]
MTNLLDTDTRAARTTADILDSADAPLRARPAHRRRDGLAAVALTAAVVAGVGAAHWRLEQPRTEPTVRAVVQTDPVSDQDPAPAAAPFSPYADWYAVLDAPGWTADPEQPAVADDKAWYEPEGATAEPA